MVITRPTDEKLRDALKALGQERPSSHLRMREEFAAEAAAKATTDAERAEIAEFGNDRSLSYFFSVVFQPNAQDPSFINVSVPALPDCNTCGENIAAARNKVSDAIRTTVLSRVKNDEPIPVDATVDTATGMTTLRPLPGQTVEEIWVTVEVPVTQ